MGVAWAWRVGVAWVCGRVGAAAGGGRRCRAVKRRGRRRGRACTHPTVDPAALRPSHPCTPPPASRLTRPSARSCLQLPTRPPARPPAHPVRPPAYCWRAGRAAELQHAHHPQPRQLRQRGPRRRRRRLRRHRGRHRRSQNQSIWRHRRRRRRWRGAAGRGAGQRSGRDSGVAAAGGQRRGGLRIRRRPRGAGPHPRAGLQRQLQRPRSAHAARVPPPPYLPQPPSHRACALACLPGSGA